MLDNITQLYQNKLFEYIDFYIHYTSNWKNQTYFITWNRLHILSYLPPLKTPGPESNQQIQSSTNLSPWLTTPSNTQPTKLHNFNRNPRTKPNKTTPAIADSAPATTPSRWPCKKQTQNIIYGVYHYQTPPRHHGTHSYACIANMADPFPIKTGQ